jgi:predicted phage-related endonuclease
MMNVIDVQQNTEDWLAIRRIHDTASEAPAALGQSKHTSRADLLKIKSSGISEDIGKFKQQLFDKGHEAEALARPFAEKIVDDILYPITATMDVSGLKLLASFDGVTMDDAIIFEHKLWSQSLADMILSGELDANYTIQMDQQLLISGAKKCLFMASDGTEEKMVWCWYESSQNKFDALILGWNQFNIDLANYVPPVVVDAPLKKITTALPVVLDMRVEGKLVSCNIEQYKPAALAYIAAINTDLDTDLDFADADADGKYCRESAKKLELSIELALGQMGDINTVIATVREIAAAFDAKGLALEKLVTKEKADRKTAIIKKARSALSDHEAGLQERTQHHLKPTLNNFEGVVKNLRTIASLQNAVDTELARCKIEASAAADRITANLVILGERKDMAALFPDVGMLVHKAADDLRNTMTARIATHEAAEAAKLEAMRVKIQQEEAAKALAAQQANMAPEKINPNPVPLTDGQRAILDAIPKSASTLGLFNSYIKVAAAPAIDNDARMNLGQIKEQIAPFSISAEGLATLGIMHVDTQGAAKYYRVSDCQRIFDAIQGLKK